MQVVWCRDDGDDKVEVVFAQPDDFFLATNATVVLAVPAGTFANGEAVFDDPREITGGDSQCPFSAKLRGHSVLLRLVCRRTGRKYAV